MFLLRRNMHDVSYAGHSSVLICFIIRVNPLETSGRHLTALARHAAFKESYLTIFVDLLFGISFELA
jgi:hypothetical protein